MKLRMSCYRWNLRHSPESELYRLQAATRILINFPSLASESFPFIIRDPQSDEQEMIPKSPLFFLAGFGAGLDDVKRIYNMNHGALGLTANRGEDSLMAGLAHLFPNPSNDSDFITELIQLLRLGRVREDVISFLIERGPELERERPQFKSLWWRSKVGDLVAYRCMHLGDIYRIRVFNTAVLCLVSKYPSCCNYKLLTLAASNRLVSKQTLSTIVSRLPAGAIEFSHIHQPPKNGKRIFDDIERLSKLIPIMEKLVVPASCWNSTMWGAADQKALHCLMESIKETGDNLRTVHIPLSHHVLQPDHLGFIGRHSLLNVKLDGFLDSQNLEVLAEILRHRKSPLNTLELKIHSPDLRALISILGCNSGARHISLYILPHSSWQGAPQMLTTTPYGDACLESFELSWSFQLSSPSQNDNPTTDVIMFLLTQLARCPSLQKIKIRPGSGNFLAPFPDCTGPVTNLLRQCHQLKELCLSPPHFKVDLTSICAQLKNNQTLRVFHVGTQWSSGFDGRYYQCLLDVLDSGSNTTLQACDVLGAHTYLLTRTPIGEKIKYLADLNRMGRKIARDTSSSRKTFVDLLIQARNEWCHPSNKYFFGLLRENPSVWANQAC